MNRGNQNSKNLLSFIDWSHDLDLLFQSREVVFSSGCSRIIKASLFTKQWAIIVFSVLDQSYLAIKAHVRE